MCYHFGVYQYLELIKPHVETSVYKRGQRLYLDGSVIGFSDAVLDGWRKYRVGDVNECVVTLPLLSITLSRSKYNQSSIALMQVVHCTCEYYKEVGPCKHIVAVCAAIDNEFGEKITTNFTHDVNVLDTIFKVETDKKHLKWLDIIEQHLSRDMRSFGQIDEITIAIRDENDIHDSFVASLKQMVDGVIGEYSKERRLVRIMTETLLLGKETWWNIWENYYNRLDEQNQVRLWVVLWKYMSQRIAVGWYDDALGMVVLFDNSLKQKITNELAIQFAKTPEIWLNFVFQSRNIEWLEEHFNALDPLNLIRAAQMMPEKREEIEDQIVEQVRVWSDFLRSGNYDEVISFFEQWRHVLGTSQAYEEAVDYFARNHGKKKKLINALKP